MLRHSWNTTLLITRKTRSPDPGWPYGWEASNKKLPRHFIWDDSMALSGLTDSKSSWVCTMYAQYRHSGYMQGRIDFSYYPRAKICHLQLQKYISPRLEYMPHGPCTVMVCRPTGRHFSLQTSPKTSNHLATHRLANHFVTMNCNFEITGNFNFGQVYALVLNHGFTICRHVFTYMCQGILSV